MNGRLIRVVLSEEASSGLTPMQEADRNQAIADLAADNHFALASNPECDTILHLSVQDGRLVFDIRTEADETLQTLVLAPGPFRSLIRDYQMLLDSYAAAVAEGREARIQTIDMGRRGLHNEGSELIMARLEGKVLLDFDTARRIFTLVCALHRRM
ncbi:MAG: UPF0262 family protein [Acidiphilium sp.]|nr:UPF0262 family protein [Acidiphilium sp.]MDD4936543.1 UPF0262 family protein [Acidiphilium sp.]